MTYHIDIQNVSKKSLPLTHKELKHLATLALRDYCSKAELTIRCVLPEVITSLNHQYRKKNTATNVLAFPSSIPNSIILEYPFLGDLVICPEVLREESKTLNKSLKAHWSLILIHGVLHLLGFDHMKTKETKRMQTVEVKLLNELGFENPYEDNQLE